jgi:hypothetical protein
MCRYCDVENGSDEAMSAGLSVHSAQETASKAMRRLEKAIATYAEALPASAKPRTLDFLKDVVKLRRRLNRSYAEYRPGESAKRVSAYHIQPDRRIYPTEFSRVVAGDILIATEAGRYYQRIGPAWVRPGEQIMDTEAPVVYEMRIDAISPRRGLYRYSSRVVWPDGTTEFLKKRRSAVLQTLIEELDGGHLVRTFEG